MYLVLVHRTTKWMAIDKTILLVIVIFLRVILNSMILQLVLNNTILRVILKTSTCVGSGGLRRVCCRHDIFSQHDKQ